MATEEELIRQLRILYGIAPDSPTVDNTGVATANGSIIADLQRQYDEAARLYQSGSMNHMTNQIRLRQMNEARQALERARSQGGAAVSAAPDPGAAEARKNASLLDSIFGGIRKSTLDDGTRELDNRFVGTLRQDRTRLAARGLTGGSAARSTQGRTLGDLLIGRQRLASAADSADQSARQTLDEQRQNTERQIKLGTQPDVSHVNALREAQAGLNQAYRGITEQALGGLFMRGADSYRDTNQADAYGRRGFGTLSPSAGRTGPAGGSIY